MLLDVEALSKIPLKFASGIFTIPSVPTRTVLQLVKIVEQEFSDTLVKHTVAFVVNGGNASSPFPVGSRTTISGVGVLSIVSVNCTVALGVPIKVKDTPSPELTKAGPETEATGLGINVTKASSE
jgi:hypothetical protein